MFLKNFIEISNDTVNTTTTLQEIVNKMSQYKLHHIIIIKDKKPIGIITEKDIVKLFKNNTDFNDLAINYATKDLVTLHSTRLVQYALSIMIDNNIRKIIVINSNDEYVGCIEQEQIVYRFEEELEETHITIQKMINSSNEAVIIDQDEDLEYALNMMAKYNLTSLLISKNGIPHGLISESDIISLAQQQINQNKKVKLFMHSPIITADINNSISDMIEKMKVKHIRRIVVNDPNSNIFHILNSKDFANNLRGNYTTFLESKLYDTRETFNALSEYVIELIDLHDEQVIYWTNTITKQNFNINIDDEITQIIPSNLWKDILGKLKSDKTIFETIKIDDKYFQIKGHYGTILDDNIIKIFLNDITQITLLNIELEKQNKLKEQLLFDQSKMAQMGEMIGNIAHQWRQPLSTISVSSSGLQIKNELGVLNDDELNMFTNNITQSAEYLSKTIDIFRNFIKEKKEIKNVVLQNRIDIALSIIDTSLKNKHIKLINTIDYNDEIIINMVVGELDQVIINIINNAKDILVEKKIDEPWIKIDLKIQNNKVILSIEDNAKGIEEEFINKIFDQYFTTKQNSNGTGLGLYMSKKIINDSLSGNIDVQNTINGAKFTIELPII